MSALCTIFDVDKASIMIGRAAEQRTLLGALKVEKSAMIAVIGRRRVGKTYLIEQTYEKHMSFHMIGQKDADRDTQLANFTDKLTSYTSSGYALKVPDNWDEAFAQLRRYLGGWRSKKKKVVFFDEVPWLDTHRSGFLSALSYFWNDWGVKNNIVLVICGSAASWMINKVVNDKGGLHNRIDHLIQLEPFTLSETKAYLKKRNIRLDDHQIAHLYMVVGGIPYYLAQVEAGKTAVQIIQQLCFDKGGSLRYEFDNLYAALFDHPEGHIDVIKTLSKKKKGLSRKEIIQHSNQTNGGGLTKILEELQRSSFITEYRPYGKKKRETLYRLTDEYSLFYLKFIKGTKPTKGHWLKKSQTPSVKTWYGYAFESMCLKHIDGIKAALGISGLYTEESSYLHKGDDAYDGIQIDLLIDRADKAIHLCEMKYYDSEVLISKKYARQLEERKAAFRHHSGAKSFLFTTLITTHGLRSNQHSLGLIDQTITLDQLF